jgi:spermidine synthase
MKYVDETEEQFDVIYIDVCDKLDEEGPASKFYCEEFYRSLKKILTPGGIVTVQAMEFDFGISDDHLIVHRALKKAFENVSSYGVYVPSFWCTWGYAMATDCFSFTRFSPERIDAVLEQRGLSKLLKHYDGQTHLHMFSLPKSLRAAI